MPNNGKNLPDGVTPSMIDRLMCLDDDHDHEQDGTCKACAALDRPEPPDYEDTDD